MDWMDELRVKNQESREEYVFSIGVGDNDYTNHLAVMTAIPLVISRYRPK